MHLAGFLDGILDGNHHIKIIHHTSLNVYGFKEWMKQEEQLTTRATTIWKNNNNHHLNLKEKQTSVNCYSIYNINWLFLLAVFGIFM